MTIPVLLIYYLMIWSPQLWTCSYFKPFSTQQAEWFYKTVSLIRFPHPPTETSAAPINIPSVSNPSSTCFYTVLIACTSSSSLSDSQLIQHMLNDNFNKCLSSSVIVKPNHLIQNAVWTEYKFYMPGICLNSLKLSFLFYRRRIQSFLI